jgi:hypothetical protein
MSTTRELLLARLTGFPAAGVAYGMAGAFVLGLACGALHAPFPVVALIGLAAAALSLRMEWRALTAAPSGGRRRNIGLQLVGAYLFLAAVGVGLVSLGDFLIGAMRH